MNENTNFSTMLKMMWDMQMPIITVEFVSEKIYSDRWYLSHHIIVQSGKDKVTDICFVDGSHTDNNYLVYIKQLDMSFTDAITEFSKKVFASQGGKLTLYGN